MPSTLEAFSNHTPLSKMIFPFSGPIEMECLAQEALNWGWKGGAWELPRGLIKIQIIGPHPQNVWFTGYKMELKIYILTSSQMTLLLLVRGLHFKRHRSSPSVSLELTGTNNFFLRWGLFWVRSLLNTSMASAFCLTAAFQRRSILTLSFQKSKLAFGEKAAYNRGHGQPDLLPLPWADAGWKSNGHMKTKLFYQEL